MIDKRTISKLAVDAMQDTQLFLVAVTVSNSNNILVKINGMQGVGIKDCVTVSRFIEHSLDRETEDFSLEVTTSGIDAAFTTPQEYKKSINKEIKINLKNGDQIIGKLLTATDEFVEIKPEQKKRNKRKVPLENNKVLIKKSEIKETKLIFTF